MSDYLTNLEVCHVGLFVHLEPPHRHGEREGPDDGPGDGPGQLWPLRPGYLVGGATGSWVAGALLLLVKAIWMALHDSRRWERCPTDV